MPGCHGPPYVHESVTEMDLRFSSFARLPIEFLQTLVGMQDE